jgi:hypothetical protein
MRNDVKKRVGALAVAAAFLGAGGVPAFAGDGQDGVKTLTVTITAKKGTPERLAASDFAVYRDDRRQEILAVKTADETPANVAVLIQDGLDQGVGHELEGIKDFIRGLPDGSRVLVGYLRGTHMQVAADFTGDRVAAARAVRLPVVSEGVVSSAPFENLIEALRRFDGLEGRNQVVMVSSGLELNRGLGTASPAINPELDRAIREAQKRGIPVWAIYANAAGSFGRSGVAVSYGQGGLNRLADETGGKAFFAGRGFVTFDHALGEIAGSLGSQYLVEYRSTGRGTLDVNVEARSVEVRHSEK